MHTRVTSYTPNPAVGLAGFDRSNPEAAGAASLEAQAADGRWATIACWSGPESTQRAQQAADVLAGLAAPGRGVLFTARPDGRLLAQLGGSPKLVTVAEFRGAGRAALAAVAALRLNGVAGAELPARLVEDLEQGAA